jgi:hypothetical protein
MTNQTLEIILEITLICIGLYLAFFKSYFKQKGKNLATMEDIEKITTKVEAIKTEFIKETEKLKIDLQYGNQIKFSLKTEELKSLFNCYEKYFLWINILLDAHFSNLPHDFDSALRDMVIKIDNAYFNFQISEAKLDLMIENDKLTENLQKMKLETLALDGFIKVKIQEFKPFETRIDRLESLNKGGDISDELRKAYDEQLIFTKSFNEQKLDKYRKVAKMNSEFRNICYNLIIPLSEKS